MRGDMRDGQQREARRALQEAAYGRDATDGDRAALAAFDRLRTRSNQELTGLEDAPATRATGSRVPLRLATAGRPRWLALASCVAAGALLSTVVTALVTQPWAPDPFDRFTDADAFVPDLAQMLAGAYELENNLDVAVVAGPVLLHETADTRVAAFMDARLDDGEQSVCLMVSERENGASLTDWSCTPRDDFSRTGITTALSPSTDARGSQTGVEMLTWALMTRSRSRP